MSLLTKTDFERNGLAQLRALMAAGRKPGILVSLDFELVEVDFGKAVFAGITGEHAYNPLGTVHGGYAATLLDSACGCAVRQANLHHPGIENCLSPGHDQEHRFGARGRHGCVARATRSVCGSASD